MNLLFEAFVVGLGIAIMGFIVSSIIGLFTLSLQSDLAGVYSHGLQQKNPETLF